jgi:hypothetical protein
MINDDMTTTIRKQDENQFSGLVNSTYHKRKIEMDNKRIHLEVFHEGEH